MKIEWDVPIEMDDGIVLRADVFRPDADGKLSGDPELRPLRQGARVPGRLQERLGPAWSRHASRTCSKAPATSIQIWEAGRSGEVGAGRLRLRAGRFARRRPLAGLSRSEVAARDQGPLRLHRMGRRAAVVERQGRPERHLLLRHEPVVRRRRCSRRISPRSASGRARPTIIASTPITAASSATSSR